MRLEQRYPVSVGTDVPVFRNVSSLDRQGHSVHRVAAKGTVRVMSDLGDAAAPHRLDMHQTILHGRERADVPHQELGARGKY